MLNLGSVCCQVISVLFILFARQLLFLLLSSNQQSPSVKSLFCMKVRVEYTQSKVKMIPKGTDDWIDGGFKYFFDVHPSLRKISILTRYFSDGLKPPTRNV